MTDEVTLIRDWLVTASTSLYTLCSTRVWCPVKPPKESWNNTVAAIIFHPETQSAANVAGSALDTVFTFKCYGGTASYSDARAVFAALFDRLHGATGTKNSRFMFRAHLITAFQGPPEPESGWPVHIAKFRVLTNN